MPVPSDSNKHAYMFSDDMKFLQKCLLIHPTDRSKFLILRRRADMKTRPNEWDYPGGNVLYGETHEWSLKREILEETGLSIEEFTPQEVISNYDEEKEIYSLIINYSADAPTHMIVLSEEHSEYQWVSLDEFKGLEPPDFLLPLPGKYFGK